jgi:hypothetical protein
MIHAHHLAADHPVIVKIAAGTPLAPADQDALYLLLADDSIRRLSLEHHLAAAGDQLGRLPPSPLLRRARRRFRRSHLPEPDESAGRQGRGLPSLGPRASFGALVSRSRGCRRRRGRFAPYYGSRRTVGVRRAAVGAPPVNHVTLRK